jgi:hypothetical protein
MSFAEVTNLGQLPRRILAVLWTADWTSLDVRDGVKLGPRAASEPGPFFPQQQT